MPDNKKGLWCIYLQASAKKANAQDARYSFIGMTRQNQITIIDTLEDS